MPFKEVREQNVEGAGQVWVWNSGDSTTKTECAMVQANPGAPEVENQPPVGSNPSPEPEGSSGPAV